MKHASMSAPMTADAFLDWVALQEERYELVDGAPVMMAGAKRHHNIAAGNVARALAGQLTGSGCIPLQSDMALATAADRIRYPDVVVDCDNTGMDDRIAADPRLVFEVLSERTRHFDVEDKLREYQGLDAVQVILLVDVRVIEVELHERGPDGAWTSRRETDPEGTIAITAVGVSLSLASIYENLDLPRRKGPLGLVG